jgi:DNA-binding transcriptional ArsR family regulator
MRAGSGPPSRQGFTRPPAPRTTHRWCSSRTTNVNCTTVHLCYTGDVSDLPPVRHPLPEPLIELVAQRFRVLGEPMRIRLLDQLREGEATVSELQAALGASQQNVSKHLGILHGAGMVTRTKEGNHARYSISDPSVFELCDQLCGGVRRQLSELDALLQP